MVNWQRSHEIEDQFNLEDRLWAEIIDFLQNSEELHHSLDFYNWGDGYEYPTLVVNRDDCDLGTIRLIFELICQDPDDPQTEFNEYEIDLEKFIQLLLSKKEGGSYPSKISYDGSPGDELVVEWKRRYTHYEMYPDEKPSDA